MAVVEVDPAFEGDAGGPGSLVKYNPMAGMTGKETWNFLRVMVSHLMTRQKDLMVSVTIVFVTPASLHWNLWPG